MFHLIIDQRVKKKPISSHFLRRALSSDQPGKSETYLEAIRKNIEWLKKHSKDEGKDGETTLFRKQTPDLNHVLTP